MFLVGLVDGLVVEKDEVLLVHHAVVRRLPHRASLWRLLEIVDDGALEASLE